MSDLRTDYKNDVLKASMNGKRHYDIVDSDGVTVLYPNVILNDVSEYEVHGDKFGKDDINAMNSKANKIDNDYRSISTKVETIDSSVEVAVQSSNNAKVYVQASKEYAEKAIDSANRVMDSTPENYRIISSIVEEFDKTNDYEIVEITAYKSVSVSATIDSYIAMDIPEGTKYIELETNIKYLKTSTDPLPPLETYFLEETSPKTANQMEVTCNYSFGGATGSKTYSSTNDITVSVKDVCGTSTAMAEINFDISNGENQNNSITLKCYVLKSTLKDKVESVESAQNVHLETLDAEQAEQNEHLSTLDNAVDTIGTTTNLLKPTLGSQVINGVTFTKNDDGTYIVSGQAQNTVAFAFQKTVPIKAGRYKLCGCPSGGSSTTYHIEYNASPADQRDLGNGAIVKFSSDTTTHFYIVISKDAIINNLVFKPMLTTNLQATYNDFVPYTGTTGKLNSDVAEIVNGKGGTISFSNEYGNGSILYKKIGSVLAIQAQYTINKTIPLDTAITLGTLPSGFIPKIAHRCMPILINGTTNRMRALQVSFSTDGTIKLFGHEESLTGALYFDTTLIL